jgi:hypothetical protein
VCDEHATHVTSATRATTNGALMDVAVAKWYVKRCRRRCRRRFSLTVCL